MAPAAAATGERRDGCSPGGSWAGAEHLDAATGCCPFHSLRRLLGSNSPPPRLLYFFFLRKKRKNSNLPKLPALFYIYLKTDCAALSLRIDVGHISAMRVGGATGRHKVRRKLEERLREKKNDEKTWLGTSYFVKWQVGQGHTVCEKCTYLQPGVRTRCTQKNKLQKHIFAMMGFKNSPLTFIVKKMGL